VAEPARHCDPGGMRWASSQMALAIGCDSRAAGDGVDPDEPVVGQMRVFRALSVVTDQTSSWRPAMTTTSSPRGSATSGVFDPAAAVRSATSRAGRRLVVLRGPGGRYTVAGEVGRGPCAGVHTHSGPPRQPRTALSRLPNEAALNPGAVVETLRCASRQHPKTFHVRLGVVPCLQRGAAKGLLRSAGHAQVVLVHRFGELAVLGVELHDADGPAGPGRAPRSHRLPPPTSMPRATPADPSSPPTSGPGRSTSP